MLDYIRKLTSLFDAPTRIRFFGLFCLMFVGTLLEMVGVGLFIPLLQLIATPEKIAENEYLLAFHNSVGGDMVRSFTIGAVLLVSFFFLKSVLIGFFIHIQNKFVFRQMSRLSTAQLRGYSNRSYAFHLGRNSADFIRNIMSSVRVVFSSGVMALLSAMMEILLTLGALVVLLLVDPTATVIAVGILSTAMGVWYLLVRKSLLNWSRSAQDSTRDMFLGINQTIGGLKEATILGRAPFFVRSFAASAGIHADNVAKLGTVGQLPRLIGEVVVIASAMSIVGLVLARTNQLLDAVPVVGVFAVAALRVLPSISRIFMSIGQIRQSVPALNDLHADFVSPAKQMVEQEHASGPDLSFETEIRLDKVSYYYPSSDAPALSNIDISINKGDTIGLVGRSGAGKTTLADVILGLLIPTAGRIDVDGQDIHTSLRSWQSRIGYVPQEIYLCDDSFRHNIAFGVDPVEIDEGQIAAVLEQAHLTEVVASLPDGLDTIVGERGVRLSGGQRQRIGIARALYHQPDVIVLDEATSSLDSRSEKIITEAIDKLKGTKTIIVIAHRLTTVKSCDRLFLLEQGTVAGEGTFEELAESNSVFREIANYPDRPQISAVS